MAFGPLVQEIFTERCSRCGVRLEGEDDICDMCKRELERKEKEKK
jgi:rRNA maturation endonuclease Nob1